MVCLASAAGMLFQVLWGKYLSRVVNFNQSISWKISTESPCKFYLPSAYHWCLGNKFTQITLFLLSRPFWAARMHGPMLGTSTR